MSEFMWTISRIAAALPTTECDIPPSFQAAYRDAQVRWDELLEAGWDPEEARVEIELTACFSMRTGHPIGMEFL